MSDLPILISTFPQGSRAEVRLCLETFNGVPRVDLRTWCDFRAGPVDARGPTKKGVSLPIADLPALAAAVREAEARARDFGLLTGEGA